jgi:hypothetical protein
MSRVQVSLPETAIGQLRTIAASTGEPTSRVAARLVLSALAGDQGGQPPVATTRERELPKPARERRRPPWLRPWDEDEERVWHLEMWASISAMCRRYPTILGGLSEHWWQDRRLVEWLSALAIWRCSIDAAAEDPREEISFHNALHQLARIIEQAPGRAGRFNPDSPRPTEWGG